jgi:hypothetical protein
MTKNKRGMSVDYFGLPFFKNIFQMKRKRKSQCKITVGRSGKRTEAEYIFLIILNVGITGGEDKYFMAQGN